MLTCFQKIFKTFFFNLKTNRIFLDFHFFHCWSKGKVKPSINNGFQQKKMRNDWLKELTIITQDNYQEKNTVLFFSEIHISGDYI